MDSRGAELRTSTEERCPYCSSQEVDRFSSTGTRSRVEGGQNLVLKGYYCLGDECLRPFIVKASA